MKNILVQHVVIMIYGLLHVAGVEGKENFHRKMIMI